MQFWYLVFAYLPGAAVKGHGTKHVGDDACTIQRQMEDICHACAVSSLNLLLSEDMS